jgi:hypothetical protein
MESVETDELRFANSHTIRDAGPAKLEDWLAIRKEAALKIDPESAEWTWSHCQIMDPYGVHSDLSEDEYQIGRVKFARSPDSDIWVWFGDLADEVRDKLLEKPPAPEMPFW